MHKVIENGRPVAWCAELSVGLREPSQLELDNQFSDRMPQ